MKQDRRQHDAHCVNERPGDRVGLRPVDHCQHRFGDWRHIHGVDEGEKYRHHHEAIEYSSSHRDGLLILNVRMRSASVVGRTPSNSAAPPLPDTFQSACSSAIIRLVF